MDTRVEAEHQKYQEERYAYTHERILIGKLLGGKTFVTIRWTIVINDKY
jgi:hypothetical protein